MFGVSLLFWFFFILNIGYPQKKVDSNAKEKTNIFFFIMEGSIFVCMKGHLFHTIHSSDNKNENKIKTQAETCFTTNLWKIQTMFIINVFLFFYY